MRQTLELHGGAYGELHLAITFTDGVVGEAAKMVTAKGWNRTERLTGPNGGIAMLTSRGLAYNPVVVLGASGLIGIDIDGDPGRALVRSLGLQFPVTVAVRTGDGGHLWYRPPVGAPPEVVKVQLKHKVTVSRDGYFCCPPARHPNGHTYAFVEGREPWTIPIAELPLPIVQLFAARARIAKASQRAATGPVVTGDRHEHLRAISFAMRRYSGASQEAIEAALLAENELRCKPPKDERLVRALAEYTYEHVAPIGDDDGE